MKLRLVWRPYCIGLRSLSLLELRDRELHSVNGNSFLNEIWHRLQTASRHHRSGGEAIDNTASDSDIVEQWRSQRRGA
jgi:hypothetical protein